ncbi:MAG: hypothetical protein WDN72_06345 [Alphaproteobacteria bacterium]
MRNTNESTGELARKCEAAIGNVGFPDLATRELFEGLIRKAASDTVDQAARSLGQQ